MAGEISEIRKQVDEFLGGLKRYRGRQQEESRMYFLTEKGADDIKERLRSLYQSNLAFKMIDEGDYFECYVSQDLYGRGVLVKIEGEKEDGADTIEEIIMYLIGDSRTLGHMQRDLGSGLEGEVLSPERTCKLGGENQ